MAQVNISHLTDIKPEENRKFAELARDVAAREVHDIEPLDIEPDTVTVLIIPVDITTSLSGAETEVQILVSGNDWPKDDEGKPANAVAAKVHFDELAGRIHRSLVKSSGRKLYVWVTPFTASGWAE